MTRSLISWRKREEVLTEMGFLKLINGISSCETICRVVEVGYSDQLRGSF